MLLGKPALKSSDGRAVIEYTNDFEVFKLSTIIDISSYLFL